LAIRYTLAIPIFNSSATACLVLPSQNFIHAFPTYTHVSRYLCLLFPSRRPGLNRALRALPYGDVVIYLSFYNQNHLTQSRKESHSPGFAPLLMFFI